MRIYGHFYIVFLCLISFQGIAADTGVKIEHAVKENALTELTLTPESERKLAIVTAKVEQRTLAKTRLLSGEIDLARHFQYPTASNYRA